MKAFIIFFSLLTFYFNSLASNHLPSDKKNVSETKAYKVTELEIFILGEKSNYIYTELESKYLGTELYSNNLAEQVNFLENYFSHQDYLLPRVVIDSSKISSGILAINVIPKSIVNVLMFNNGPDNKLINEYTNKILAEEHPSLHTIAKYLALMNRIPGYQVENEYKQTKNKDEVILVLNISKNRVDYFGSVDSYGTSNMGQMENYLSATVYDKNGGSDSWGFSGFTTNHPDRLFSLSTIYTSAINSYGTNLTINATHSENNSTLVQGIHTTNGKSNTLLMSFNHLLYMDKNQTLEGEFDNNYKSIIGYTLDSDNGNVYDSKSSYFTSGVSLKYSASDGIKGYTVINNSFSQGITGKFKNYTDGTNIGDKHYNLYQSDITRNQVLPYNFSIFNHVQLGHSNHTLPSTEMYSIGGRDFGRGYASGTLAGRKIIATSVEFRYDHSFENNQWLDSAQPYIFRDFGFVGKQGNDTDISHLSSYGGGIRFNVLFGIDLEGEVAQPMKKNYNLSGTPTTSNTNYSAIISKSLSF